MTTIGFALGALILCVAGHFLVTKTSPFQRTGAREYEQKLRRRTIGYVLYTVGGILFVITAIQLYLNFDAPTAATPDPLTAVYVAPKLPPPPPPPDTTLRAHAPPTSTEAPTSASSSAPMAAPTVTLDQPKSEPDAAPPTDVPMSAAPVPKMSPFESPSASANDATTSAASQDPVWKPKMPDPEQVTPLSKDAQAKFDADLAAANAAIAQDPSSTDPYLTRGNLYVTVKKWSLAEKDFQHVLDLDGKNSPARVALAQTHFYMLNFDKARAEFDALKTDKESGDFAAYQVFLCDLITNHIDAAKKELDVFNDNGDEASYYFGNVAWNLRQKKFNDGHDWLASAQRIYDVKKFTLYARSLVTLGYLNEQPAQ